MRQSTMIAALVVVVLAAALAAWFMLEPGRTAKVNSTHPDFALNVDSGLPLQPADKRPALPTPDPRPDRGSKPETGEPEAVPPPAEGEYQLRGKIVLPPEVAALGQSPLEWSSDVYICYLPDGESPDDTVETFAPLDDGMAFRRNIGEEELGLEDGTAITPGRWQVLYCHEGNNPPTLYDLADVDASTLLGLVTPTITGRVIDFGTITIDADLYFYHYALLTGRLVHSSGRPLAYSGSFYLEGLHNGSYETNVSSYIHAGKDGGFVAVVLHRQIRDLAGPGEYTWTLSSSGDFDLYFGQPEGIELPKPQWQGRRGNFGDIKLKGALIEIVLKSDLVPVTRPDGTLKIDEWGDYEGEFVRVYFEGTGVYVEACAYPQPHTTVTVLPEGRYLWSAVAEADGFYPVQHGVLMARHDQVLKLELEFKPYASIPLLINKGADPPPSANPDTVRWTMVRGEEQVSEGSYYPDDEASVPVLEGCETSVVVSCPGFLVASGVARPGMQKLEINLVRSTTPVTTLVVVVPAFPKAIQPGVAAPFVSVQVGNNGHNGNVKDWGEKPVESVVVLQVAGSGKIALYGGQNYGYPNGVLSGPIEFEIAEGETRRIELPAIAAPPWDKPLYSFRISARTSGRSIDLEACVRYKDMKDPVKEELNDDESIFVRGQPVALTDGFDDFPVQAATGEKFEGTLSFDLPHTLEVRLMRAGLRVEQFKATVTRSNPAAPALFVKCTANAVDGVAWLWIPRGKANLEVTIDGREVYTQSIDVMPGQTLQVEAGSNLLRVVLEVPEGSQPPDSDFEVPDLWTLQQGGEEGEWWDQAGLSKTSAFLIPAGRYRAVPWTGGAAVEFEISEDKVVRLPAIEAPSLGQVLLKYDVSTFDSDRVEVEFYYQLTHMLSPADEWIDGKWISATLVPDGFKLHGLPLDTELVIWGGAWVYQDSGEYELLLKPMNLSIKKEGGPIEAVLKRGVQLDDEWFQFHARWLTGIENFHRETPESALPGRHEIAIYLEGEIVHKEWVTIPETSEEPFKIPNSLRQELIAREMLEPEEAPD